MTQRKVRAVLVQTEPRKGKNLLESLETGALVIAPSPAFAKSNVSYTTMQLLIVDAEAPIEINQWYVRLSSKSGMVSEVLDFRSTYDDTRLLNDEKDCFCNDVIAAYPPINGVPQILPSFLRDYAYRNKTGLELFVDIDEHGAALINSFNDCISLKTEKETEVCQ